MAKRETDGYVLNVPPDRRDTLLEDQWPAEPVPEFLHSRSHPLVCFVGFEEGAITHLALGRRGVRAGSDRRRLNLEELTQLSTHVRHQAVLDKIPGRFRQHVERRLADGGLLPPGSFGAVVEAVRSLLPESNALLDRFSEKRRELIAGLSERARNALAYQKETVATALALAGLDIAELRDWQPQQDIAASFLDGLPQARLREDQMLVNDLQNFPGFEIVRTMQHGAAVFRKDDIRLTVVMANRHVLEEQTGADLIYRNEAFGSFVFVQYKAMEDEWGPPTFRLPNAQLAKELERMEALATKLRECEPDGRLSGFRLAHNPFFLKFCPRIVFDPDSRSLIKGMYIPLEYWRRLEGDPCIEGERGGRAVTYRNVGRYFSNTSFVELVAGGWIGTTGAQTDFLDPLIREIVESGRTVTIAIKSIETRPTVADAVVAERTPDEPLITLDDLLEGESPDEQ
jgi:hypothetical protein